MDEAEKKVKKEYICSYLRGAHTSLLKHFSRETVNWEQVDVLIEDIRKSYENMRKLDSENT